MHLVAVHGNGGGAFRFGRLPAHMPPGVALRAVTLPGFGGTPWDPAVVVLADLADRLGEAVAATPRPRVVLGHGIGGSLALDLVQRAPELMDGLILHAPVGPRLERRWFPRVMARPAVREAARRLAASPRSRPLLARRVFAGPVPPADLERFQDGYARCAAFSPMFDLITPGWFGALGPVRMPSVVLWGGRDRVLAPGQAADVLPLLPDARLVVVPEWDHFPMLDAPAHYAHVVAGLAAGLALP
ncbi:MAG: alpha/beta hydrolase [Thermoleophilia bacterium]|nr:alpha/beta hydrolase [Thermoleophilia bacterium]